MKICRVCLQGEETNLISIFSKVDDTVIAHVIVKSCSIQLADDDGLPNQICNMCVQDVKVINSFVSKVLESDLKLRQRENVSTEETTDFEVVVVKTESMDESKDSFDECMQENIAFKNQSESESDRLVLKKSKAKKNPNDVPAIGKKQVRRKRRKNIDILSDIESEEENEKDIVDEKELEMFQIITLPENSFVCCCCFRYFNSQEELESHVEIHKKHAVKNTESICCTVCKRKFSKSDALKRHLKKVKSVTKLYECVKCKIRFMGTGWRMHARRHPKGIEEKMKQEYGEIICCVQNCSESFDSEELLIKHGHEAHKLNKRVYELEDATVKPVECPVCFKRFSSERLLRRHRKRNSKPLSHQCATCGLKFRTKDVLSIHELNHASQKPFQCDVCQKRFSSKSSLKVHQKIHANDKPFICATCGAGFYQKAQLTTHEYNHSDAPLPFPCEMCEKSFKAKNYLINHMRLHTGEKPYPCRHCVMTFSNHTTRQRHEMNHTGIKPFKCSYCDKTFTIKRLQLEHECKHTGIKPYKCSYCEKTFIRKRFQVDHESSHTGVKPYRCEMCNRTFSQKSGLRRHLESHPLAPENAIALAAPSPMPLVTSQLAGEPSMSPPPASASTLAIMGEPGPSGNFFQPPQNLSVSIHPSV